MQDTRQIIEQLRGMPDAALKQFAMLHKNDPMMMPLAVSEDGRRKQMRNAVNLKMAGQEPPKVVDQALAGMGAPQPQPQASTQLPEDQGIGQLPAQNLQRMAEGGIAGYATGGKPDGLDDAQRRGMALFERALDMENIRDPKERAFLKSIHWNESKWRDTSPTSNKQAVGPMQIKPTTFKDVAPKLDINKPLDNMRGGIRYGAQGYREAKGNPQIAGVFYYGGPTARDAALQGKVFTDKANPKAPNTFQYADVVAKNAELIASGRLPTYNASNTTAVIPTRDDIPSHMSEADKKAQAAKASAGKFQASDLLQLLNPEKRREIGEAGLAVGSNILNTIPAGIAGIYKGVTGTFNSPQERQAAEQTAAAEYFAKHEYAPRTVGGAEKANTFSKFLSDDLHLPPYIAGAGVAGPKAAVPENVAKAVEAAAPVAERIVPAAEKPSTIPKGEYEGLNKIYEDTIQSNKESAEVSQNRTTAQQLADKQTSEARAASAKREAELQAVQDKINAKRGKTAKGRAQLEKEAADLATSKEAVLQRRAKEAAQKQLDEAARAKQPSTVEPTTTDAVTPEYTGAPTSGYITPMLNTAGKAGVNAGNAVQSDAQTLIDPTTTGGPTSFPPNVDAKADLGETPPAPPKPPEAKKEGLEQLAAEKPRGFTNDDWLTFGLNMLQGKARTGNMLSDLASSAGSAGLATLAGRKEREKTEQDRLDKSGLNEYYREMAAKAKAEAGYTGEERAGGAARKTVAELAQKTLADWEKNKSLMAEPITAAERTQVFNDAVAQYSKLLGLTPKAPAPGAGAEVQNPFQMPKNVIVTPG